ncbi:MAG TPA: RodZ domain-containing protein [Candidatus Limnocylindria bacterium]
MTEEVHKLGEVLRAAREAKGVDLVRVERETKIRERYLAALEEGEYRELPGAVYTRGFLRNYGAYLGLDSEYLIDLYRLETSSAPAEPAAMHAPPKPLATRRSRAFVVTPGLVFAALLTIGVGGFVAWLGYEFVNFARTPELRITEPAGNVSAHPDLTITVRGTTAPNARIAVSNLRENPTATADASGEFEITVGLVPGSNVMRLIATDPVTGRDSEVEERTIIVVSQEPTPGSDVAVILAEPAPDAEISGPVTIRGTAQPGVVLTVSAELETGPAPSFAVTSASGAPIELEPEPPSAPEPLSITADTSGAFDGSLVVPAGTWRLTVSPATGDPVTSSVTVGPGDGLRATIEIVDGESYLLLEEDGQLVEEVSGLNAAAGDRVELEAEDALRVRVGNAGAVRITINGINLGLMGDDAQVVEWRITRAGG